MENQWPGDIAFTWRNTLTVIGGCLLFISIGVWVTGVLKLDVRDLLSAGGLYAFGVLLLLLSRIRN